jgi:hypothetical protein
MTVHLMRGTVERLAHYARGEWRAASAESLIFAVWECFYLWIE